MRTLTTPGVFVEEIASFPPSVAPVATAVPGFIGHTRQAVDLNGDDLTNVPRRITSLLEYERMFGRPAAAAVSVQVTKRVSAAGAILGVNVGFATPPPALPPNMMYYAMQHYFANGGGPCYVLSIADETTARTEGRYTTALTTLQSVDEVTLILFPDAISLANATQHGNIMVAALQSCAATQDRIAVADVFGADGAAPDPFTVGTAFRTNVGSNSEDLLKYGCAYYPYLRTSLPRIVEDSTITIAGASELITVADDGTETTAALFDTDADTVGDDTTLDADVVQGTATTPGDKAVLNAVRAFLTSDYVTLPPSAAVAGAIARQDRLKGVHYAPANIGLFNTLGPVVPITNDLNGRLNVDATGGKSINVIRTFTGKGTLIWGARTLAGNSNDNRYLNVRRFLNFAEESIEKAVGAFVFAPNDANTWVRVRSMIENFLTNQWAAGALVGPKPEDAFQVQVGLNQTMTFDDILNGLMIVRVGLAISRPAEFIVLQFEQIQQQA
ncbi:phage tail sheath subtilisin-like domain-containing protein [Tropicimonas sp. TH_r6]|uniref:phage tail sheath family protein n=1 Tax=Tropicimonas sp. TH_r6 TaxID=3082085 RepID=UPI0029546464|nr:phage tail sheath C-terminal domain-containing protein [Tropicimonas sp. TH_r6]MDV7144036.1 phage tail sheath subtilisin-like domain-containing protein [Tropicimonas sp. TH_r6]